MKNVSKEFLNVMQERRNFYHTADISFADGRKVSLGKNDLSVQGNNLVESPDSSSFPLGAAISKRLTLQIKNSEDQFYDYDFAGAKIQVNCRFDLDEIDDFAGRNLLLNSAKKKMSLHGGANATYETDVSVPEWGSEDAIRAYGTKGTSNTFGIFGAGYAAVKDENYVCSVYVKNNGKNSVSVSNNGLGAADIVRPGESQRIVLHTVGNGIQYLQINLSTSGEEFDVICWHPKIEKGTQVTEWTLAPEDIRTETINLGEYTVLDPETYGSTITVTAVDNMHKADKDYSTSLSYPLQMGAALRDSCSSCGLFLLNSRLPNEDYVIKNPPTNLSHRQFIGLCAMIAGGNAVCDESGRVKIVIYDFSAFEHGKSYNGGIFDDATPYATGDDVNGGTFVPWTEGDNASGGTFKDMGDYHVLYRFQNCTVATDDVQITGLKTVSDDTEYTSGTEGYMLSLENQLMSGNEQDAIDRIGKLIIGLKFRPFEIDHVSFPLAEFGDLCYVIDRKYRIFQSVITDIDYTFNGFTVMKCSADSPIRNSSRYPSNSATQAIVKSRTETQKQITDYDVSVQMLTSIMANSLGMFTTVEKTGFGGEIVYQHNKPNLSDSNIVWKKSEQGFVVSTDGGKTWNAGIDANGNAVVNVLSAIGINFDWARGGELTLGGKNNGNGRLIILDETGKQVGYIDNTGVYFDKGVFSGTMNAGTVTGSSVIGTEITGSNITGSTIKTKIGDNTEYIALGKATIELYSSSGEFCGKIEPKRERTVISGESSYIPSFSIFPENYFTVWMKSRRVIEALYSSSEIIANAIRLYLNGTSITYSADNVHNFHGAVYMYNGLTVSGTKARTVKTYNYDDRSLYCYEMPSPMFGDIGEAIIDETGECIIDIDDIFSETISGIEYQVFLQKEGPGDIWVAEKQPNYFIVKGTENLKFAWEIKAIQRDYEIERLEESVPAYPDSEIDLEIEEMEQSYLNEVENYIQEQEDIYNETVKELHGDEYWGTEPDYINV